MSAVAGKSDIEVKGFCFLHRTCPLLGAKRTSLLPHVTFPKGQYRPLRSSARIRRVIAACPHEFKYRASLD